MVNLNYQQDFFFWKQLVNKFLVIQWKAFKKTKLYQLRFAVHKKQNKNKTQQRFSKYYKLLTSITNIKKQIL